MFRATLCWGKEMMSLIISRVILEMGNCKNQGWLVNKWLTQNSKSAADHKSHPHFMKSYCYYLLLWVQMKLLFSGSLVKAKIRWLKADHHGGENFYAFKLCMLLGANAKLFCGNLSKISYYVNQFMILSLTLLSIYLRNFPYTVVYSSIRTELILTFLSYC